jgi:integrase
MRLTINGRRWDSALKIKIGPSKWDAKRQVAISDNDEKDSNLINETIESLRFRIHKIKLKIEDEGKLLTIESIRDKLIDKEKFDRTILKLFQNHNDECKLKVGIQVTQATYGRYLTCYKHLGEFINKEFKAEYLPVSSVNRRFYERFEFFLKKEKKCAHNTTIKYIRNFNKIVRITVEQGWLAKSPYRDIGYRLEEIDKPYLSMDEVNSILKEIADLTGIKKTLTTHTARRVFATTIMLQNGVNMEAVSKMLGHTSLFMTRKYAKVDEFYIAQETEKVRKIFMKKD